MPWYIGPLITNKCKVGIGTPAAHDSMEIGNGPKINGLSLQISLNDSLRNRQYSPFKFGDIYL